MSHVAGHSGEQLLGRFNSNNDGFEHWKYPETVGNDTTYGGINFNSNETSEYAIARMDAISENTQEPFMLFEFMKVDNDDYGSTTSSTLLRYAKKTNEFFQQDSDQIVYQTVAKGGDALTATLEGSPGAILDVLPTRETLKEWAKKIGTLVKRKYTGSIGLYMPTDIQINDQMIYNEDSRKMGALVETAVGGNISNLLNPTTLTSTAAVTALGAVVGSIPILPGGAVMTALVSAGLSDIAGVELQRGSGKLANPNEILMYQSTAMRSFSFTWTILPDSADESHQAAGLIKLFRKSAHARKDNLTLVTVPDHVIVSFHGAKDMIQLPPCVIESVNVTYNPNSSSFFKENNAPVEIGLAVTLKEMAPIYAGDVERGY